MNDWRFQRLLVTVLSLTLALWGSVALEVLGFRLWLLRAAIGLFYMMFLPGILVLRSLRLHKLGRTDTLVYATGISVAALMLVGVTLNGVAAFVGIQAPISLMPVLTAVTALVLTLSAVSYSRDGKYVNPEYLSPRDLVSAQALLLCVTLVLALLGTTLASRSGTNLVLVLMILVVALICVLVGFGLFFPSRWHPATLLVITLSLLYTSTLISPQLVEWGDASFEYFAAETVIKQAAWNSGSPVLLNGVLSLTILAPVTSIVSGIDVLWIFKVVYPLVFSLVPVGLFQLFRRYLNPKIAFLAAFFFLSFFTFYTAMLGANREQIAELFLTLLVLALLDNRLGRLSVASLSLIFSAGLVVSHYALSYIFMLALVPAWGIQLLMGTGTIRRKPAAGSRMFDLPRGELSPRRRPAIPASLAAVYVVMTVGWYMYVSGSTGFVVAVQIANQIGTSIFSDFLSPSNAQGLAIVLAKSPTPLGYAYKSMHLAAQGLIVLGFGVSLLRRFPRRFPSAFLWISLPFLAMNAAALAVPFFASAVNTTRLLQVTLMFLAPFGIIGAAASVEQLKLPGRKMSRAAFRADRRDAPVKAVTVFFVVYFLFNVGLVYQLAGQPVYYPLDVERVPIPHFTGADVLGVSWLTRFSNGGATAYADAFYAYLLEANRGSFTPLQGTARVVTPIDQGSYLLLGTDNVASGTVRLDNPALSRTNYTTVALANLSFPNGVPMASLIYDNGDAEIEFF